MSKEVAERAVPSHRSGSIIDQWDDDERTPSTTLVEPVKVARAVLFSEEHVFTPSQLPKRMPRVDLDLDVLDSAEDD